MTRPKCHGLEVDNLVLQAEKCKQKLKFRDKAEAKRVAKMVTRLHGKKNRVYHCPVCEMYHLTTQEK